MKKKMLISITLIFVLLLSYLAPFSAVFAGEDPDHDEETEEVVDPNVYLQLNAELYKGIKANLDSAGITLVSNDANHTMTVTPEIVDQVTTLRLSNYGISDLTGLGTFTNVKYLDLSANNLSANSHLDEINNMTNLTELLDLSSNSIKDISSINLDILNNVGTLNLHNQKFKDVKFIQVDTSIESNQPTAYEFDLPQILQWGTEIETTWINDYSDPRYPNTTERTPYVDWRPFNSQNPEKLKVIVGDDSGNTYKPYYGLVKVEIKVTDQTNRLYNSDMSLFFVVINQNERGIEFVDENLYWAIKDQLTKYQIKNPDVMKDTNTRNLYKEDTLDRYYDEALTLVIDADDINNRIPTLRLQDCAIKDLTGIEYFVGLERELSVEGNYITTFEKIRDLIDNKETEERILQTKVSKILSRITADVNKINAAIKKLQDLDESDTELTRRKLELEREEAQAKAEKLDELYNKKAEYEGIRNAQRDIADAYQAVIDNPSAHTEMEVAEATAKHAEAERLYQDAVNKLEVIYHDIEELENPAAAASSAMQAINDQLRKNQVERREQLIARSEGQASLEVDMPALYSAFNKAHEFTRIITPQLELMSDDDLNSLTLAEEKALVSAQLSRLSAMENALSTWEFNYIRSKFDYFDTYVTTVVDGEEKIEVIKDPLKTYLSKYLTIEPYKNYGKTEWKQWLKQYKEWSKILELFNYCQLYRLFYGTTDCVVEELLDVQIEEADWDGNTETKAMLERIKANLPTIMNTFRGYGATCSGDLSRNATEVYIYKYSADVSYTATQVYHLAQKIALHGSDIGSYVVLPKLEHLNMRRNKLTNLNGLEKLPELKFLYLGKNEIINIDYIDWSLFTQLRQLDLSYNFISNIKPLEVIHTLELLDLSRNLISGVYDFDIAPMTKLYRLDFSYNQITDISLLKTQIAFKAKGEREISYRDVAQYLKDGNLDIRFWYQHLEMDVELVNQYSQTYVELPPIFRQVEQLDYMRSSLDVESRTGTIEENGKYILVDTRTLGDHTATAFITNTTDVIDYDPDYDDYKEGITEAAKRNSIGRGSSIDVHYKVVEPTPEPDPDAKKPEITIEKVISGTTAFANVLVSYEDGLKEIKGTCNNVAFVIPETDLTGKNTVSFNLSLIEGTNNISVTAIGTDDSENTVTADIIHTIVNPDPVNPDPVNPDPVNPDPVNPDPVNPDPGTITSSKYVIVEDEIYNVSPKTSVAQFKSNIEGNYILKVVKERENAATEVTTGYIGTGMILTVYNQNGEIIAAYEIAVKGDINGDGLANATDSYLIKSARAEIITLTGIKLRAADINMDNKIDAIDQRLLLYHRAEVPGYTL